MADMDSFVIVIDPEDLDWLVDHVEWNNGVQADRVRKCLENPWTVWDFLGKETP